MLLHTTLRSGAKIPLVGFGTVEDNIYDIVTNAIEFGYRHFDGAEMYDSEEDCGHAMKDAITKGIVQREDLFVVSALWGTSFRPQNARAAINKSLKDLGFDYIDLYLLQIPMSYQKKDREWWPKGPDGKLLFDDVDYLDAWRQLEQFQREGLVRHIGVSNFNRAQLERLMAHADIAPEVLQCESHPYFQNERLFAFARSHGIVCTAYSPFGALWREQTEGEELPLNDAVIAEIALAHKRTPAQVIIRWQIQRGCCVLVQSKSPDRIRDNFKVWDFTLTEEEMARIAKLERGKRLVRFITSSTHTHYPFNDDY